jgi:predicted MFS family arabinose efflux permease
MSFPFELFLFGVAFFGFMAVFGAVRAYRKKEKAYYLSSMASFLVVLAFFFAFLNQVILALIIFVATGILGIVGLPRMLKASERELAKQRQEVDLSAPLKARDFLTNKGWLKLASKYGLWKTMFLIYLLSVVIIGGILFTLSTFSSFITIGYVASSTAIAPILVIYMFYRPFKKALGKK